jgi:tetratricopeptide (TPR) repeat protein
LDETVLDLSQEASFGSLDITSQSERLAAESDPLTDATQLMEAIGEDVSALFALSIAARKASNRDRYTRALQKIAVSDVLPDDTETERITELFPTLRFPELRWLKTRLVSANNSRRRYLKYCEEHQKASVHASEDSKPQYVPLLDSADAISIGAATRATTFTDTAFSKAWEQPQGSDNVEEQSLFSYDTQTYSDLAYVVPDLEDINGGKDLFICPFCRVEQSIHSQHAWKKHVFKDLKAYVCVFETCSLFMFETSQEWLAHMLSAHLKVKQCPYCSKYDPSQDLHQHMSAAHTAAIHPSQVPILLRTSVKELDRVSVKTCQFCDWHTKLNSDARTTEKGKEIYVPLQRYRRHVSAHLEEIALSTVTESKTAVELPSKATSEVGDDMECEDPVTLWQSVANSGSPSQAGSEEDSDAKDDDPANQEIITSFPSTNMSTEQQNEATRSVGGASTTKQGASAEDNSDRLTSQHQLAHTYLANGQITEAVETLEHIVKVQEKLAEDHPSRLVSQHELARAYLADGQITKAVETLEHVVKVQEKLSEDHPSRLASQHALARAYQDNGQITKAVETLEHVVKVQEKLSEDHPSRLASQHALAGAYQDNGQISRAVETLEHVVKVQEKLSEDHPSRLVSQHALAGAYQDNGQISEAVEILEYIVKVQEKLSEDHPSRLVSQHALAGAYQDNGKISEAVEILEYIVKVQEKLSEKHPDRLASQHQLACTYLANGQIKDAVQQLEHVVAIHKRVLAEDHSDRVASQHELARAYLADGQITKAVEMLEHVVKVQEKLAEDHPSRLASQHELARAYLADGQISKAAATLEYVVIIKQKKFRVNHPSRIVSEDLLASLMSKEEKAPQ